MNEIMTTVFGLAGGLAMFLFGMNSMSDALQKAAGERMKQILSFLTKNPIMGALAGALVTAVLQSSSADHGYGHWFCQRGSDDAAAGYFGYLRCEHRHDDDRPADGV